MAGMGEPLQVSVAPPVVPPAGPPQPAQPAPGQAPLAAAPQQPWPTSAPMEVAPPAVGMQQPVPSWVMRLGLNVVDERMTKLVENVILVSILILIVNLISVFLSPKNVYQLCAACAVPACGYFGAKQNNKDLMMCFCGWNFCYTCCNACFAVMMLASASTCLSAAYHQQNDDICQYMPRESGLTIPLVIFVLVNAVLQLVAGVMGHQLYTELSSGRVVMMVPVMPTMGVQQHQPQQCQPQQQQQQQPLQSA
mmetsp:Transcript_116445/g.290804  ORF Transcript_116445/g.290804 Transcript_116445/m.290804 type:complete len:251 (+) Transcript_116445:86-838(+)